MKTFVSLLAATDSSCRDRACQHTRHAQQKMVLKASDVHPAGYPTVVAVEEMAKS